MAPVACLEDDINQCERADSCVTLRLWTMLDDAIKGVIDKVTLQDMLDWNEEKGDNYIIQIIMPATIPVAGIICIYDELYSDSGLHESE